MVDVAATCRWRSADIIDRFQRLTDDEGGGNGDLNTIVSVNIQAVNDMDADESLMGETTCR